MDLTADIDTVAEAIWQADRCGIARCPRKVFGWAKLDAGYQERYRRMAQAAIDGIAQATIDALRLS